MRNPLALLFALGMAVGAGCSNPLNSGVSDMGMNAGADLAVAQVETFTSELISSEFTIPAGDEFYQCERIVATQDLYILDIKPISPTGVHHEVVAIDPGNSPPGKVRCGPIGQNWSPLFASGVGSGSMKMPPGVALKVAAGQTIVLNLHLFNATPNAITNTAAVEVVSAKNAASYELAGVVFIGPVNFTINDPMRQVSGACRMSRDTKFFAVFPHMHQTGEQIKIWATTPTGDKVVWDKAYDFNDQSFGSYADWAVPGEIALERDDDVNVTCTYSAAGAGKVFGDSSTDEMCFGISYFHPVIDTTFGTPFCLF